MYLYLEDMNVIPLVSAVILYACYSFGNNFPQKKNEFTGGSPYYELRTSKHGKKFFVIPPGPCACGGLEPDIQCVNDIKKTLSEHLKNKDNNINSSSVCAPNAGCKPSREKIFADCRKN